MPISKDDVKHVARLARLSFTDEELDRFTDQLSKILAHAEQVEALTTDDIPPTSHSLPLRNVYRPDEIGECLPQDKALSTGPEIEDGRFKVPRIIEDA